MPRDDEEPLVISGEVVHETEMAYLFNDGKTEVWLPKSRCEWDEGSSEMSVPEWLALKKGLI